MAFRYGLAAPRYGRACVVLELALLGIPGLARGQSCTAPAFGPPTDHPTGGQPRSVTAADFDGDGRIDLATANQTSDTVSIFLGDGTGGFGAGTSFGTGSGPTSIAAADFNGDGSTDLATANFGSADVSVLLGTGSGSFGPPTSYSTGPAAFSVAAGTFNADSVPDLAVANQNSNTVSILLGTGSGGFGAATNLPVGMLPRSVAVGDFNEDGENDLAVANFNAGNVSILLGTGTGSFGAPVNFGVGFGPFCIAVVLLNADSHLDLAVANTNTNNVSILLGTGSGGFGAAMNFGAGIAPVFVTSGDFDADGVADLAVANRDSNNTSILMGTGSGSFGAATNFPAGVSPFSIAVKDFNQDAKLDFAVTNNGSDTLSVRLNDFVGDLSAVTIATGGPTAVCGNCTGGTVTVTDTGGGPATHQWGFRTTSGGAITSFGGETGASYVIQGGDFPAPGNYLVVVTTSPTCGSPLVSNELAVQVGAAVPMQGELAHGSTQVHDLRALPGPIVHLDYFRLRQRPRSSYEIVVDGTSGDLGLGAGPTVQRIDADATTVLQQSAAIGAGSSRSLRWENASTASVDHQLVRVQSAECGTDCGPEDVYRIRAYETTYSIPRFNNSGSQVTVLLLQNTSDATITGNVHLWRPDGSLAASNGFSVATQGLFSLNTATLPGAAGLSGTITIAHDGRYGALAGKTVALEPATGFTFDSPVVPRPR